MNKIAICDNDFFYRRDLEQLCLEYYGSHGDILLFDDSEKLIAALEDNIFDVIFLDTDMRQKNGIEVKLYLEDMQIDSAIIFIARNAMYMREAFGKNVYGYMEKPVQKEQLFSILNRIHGLSACGHTMLVKDIYGRDQMVKTGDIYYIAGEANYTRIFFKTQESLLVYSTLKKWMEILDTGIFVRIHKSYIVNLCHVKSMDKQADMGSYVLPISKSRQKQVRQLYKVYLSRK